MQRTMIFDRDETTMEVAQVFLLCRAARKGVALQDGSGGQAR
jgi:hypothetical protein